MIFEWDDFGCNHKISDMCQSHDCREKLDELHMLNPAFKATLFAIPGEMTQELLNWCSINESWIELALHGFYHMSNYECEKMSYEEFEWNINKFKPMLNEYFVNGFRAPGWQISGGVYTWLKDSGWWVADQAYNDDRRPEGLRTYLYNDNTKEFSVRGKALEAYHGHVWDVGWNGIYEDFEKVSDLVKNATEFKFVSELFEVNNG